MCILRVPRCCLEEYNPALQSAGLIPLNMSTRMFGSYLTFVFCAFWLYESRYYNWYQPYSDRGILKYPAEIADCLLPRSIQLQDCTGENI